MNGLTILKGKNKMDECLICGSKHFNDELVNKVYEIDGEPVIVRDIPSYVCKNCGEKYFTGITHEKVMDLIYHSNTKPETFTGKAYHFA